MDRKIVNIRYKLCGLNFDAAIDYGHILHDYNDDERKQIPIELYCFDRPEWDVVVTFQGGQTDNFVEIGFDKVIQETEAWVAMHAK